MCPGGRLVIEEGSFRFHDVAIDYRHDLSAKDVIDVCGPSIAEAILTRVPEALAEQASWECRKASEMVAATTTTFRKA